MLQKLSIQSRLLLSGLLMLSLIGTTLYLPSTMSANAKLVSQTTRLDQQIRAANEVRNSFGEYRSWISDMAVSLMATRKSIFSATLSGRRSTPAATRGAAPDRPTSLRPASTALKSSGTSPIWSTPC